MRTYSRGLKIASSITLSFFLWSFGPLFQVAAFAAEKQGVGSRPDKVGAQGPGSADPSQSPLGKGGSRGMGATSGERFEKALDEISDNVAKSEKRVEKGEDDKAEQDRIRAKRSEIESLDIELKKEFTATEKKLKDAKLPQEILDRHYKFVKHYEDNLKELKTNLDDVEKATTKADRKAKIAKAKAHLEKTKTPSKHVPLDPNKLPFRTVKAKERAPRLKKEEFERDFPRQKKPAGYRISEFGVRDVVAAGFSLREKVQQKRILLAYNSTIDSDMPLELPLPLGESVGSVPERFNRGMRGGLDTPHWDNSLPDFVFSELTPHSARATPKFMVAQATVVLPTADDLAETPEVQFTPEIRAKAQDELGCNPTKIFNWVRNNINYEPYYGSFKNAGQTLLEGAGNDFDQASLLVGLMRVCNIASKYSYGTVEIPAEKTANMVGVSDPRAAANILATQGIPSKLVIEGSTVKAIQMERVWVESWIDYFPSWGALHKQGGEDTWISLDPSFKQITLKPGMDMYAEMGFNAEDFLTSYITDTRDITAYQDYSMRLIDFVDTHYPDATIDQVFGASDIKSTKTIVKQEFPYLLGTLPYKTIVKAAEFSQVPPTKDYAIMIQIEGNTLDGTPGLNYSGYLNYLADKRVTISYEPATLADEALVGQYGGNMLDVPPYLLTVKPVLKTSGMTVATGAPIGLGQDQNIIINFSGPDGDMDRIQNVITAGAYSAIVLQSQNTPVAAPSKNMVTLVDNSKKIYLSDVTLDDLLGQMLYSIGVSYFHKLSFENAIYAKNLHLINLRQPAEAMVTHKIEVSYLYGMPRAASEGGLNMDVDRNVNVVVSPNQDGERIKAFMILSGLSSSAWENRIMEVFLQIPSVSTTRLLKLASDQGITIYNITDSNLNEILPQLQVSSDVKTDIVNAVNAGKKIIISKTNIAYNQWNGVGYVVMNPTNGAAGYMINGGLLSGPLCQDNKGLRLRW
ncbi:MAG: transglutaminase-like domain-containing protein [Nitrospirota bacterium]